MLRIIVVLVAITGTVLARAEPQAEPEAESSEAESSEAESSEAESSEVERDAVEDGSERAGEIEARTRFELGQQLYEQGRFEEALDQFRAAHELSGRAGFLYNIYLCHRDAGNTRDAASTLRAYLEAEPETNNRAMLERRLETLEEQVAAEDEAARRAEEAERLAAAREVDRNFTGPVVTLVSGAVVLAAAGSLGLANRSLRDSIAGRCYDGEVCLSEEQAEIDSLDRRNLTADVLMGVGAAAALAGVIWLVVEATRSDASDASDAVSEEPRVALACGVTRCELRGRF